MKHNNIFSTKFMAKISSALLVLFSVLIVSDVNAQISSTEIIVHPVPTLVAPSNAIYCFGVDVPEAIISGTPGGVTFSISGGADIGLADHPGTTVIPLFTTTNPGTTTVVRTITLTPTANGCFGPAVTFTITVLLELTMNDQPDIIACAGADVTPMPFSGAPTGSVYTWVNNNDDIGLGDSGAGNITTFEATNSSCVNITGIITITPQLAEPGLTCQGTPTNFEITVRPRPNGTIAGNTICVDGDPELTFTSTCGTGPFELEIATGGATPYVLYSDIDSGEQISITPKPTVTTTYDLMKITDSFGCTNPE